LLLAFGLLLAHMAYFYPYTPDDTFISLRYAQRLVEGKGLTWNDGEYVEGYSNPLWVMLAAALNIFSVDLLNAVQLMGAIFTGLTLFVFARYARQFALPTSSLLLGACTFSLTAPVAIWAVGGLEMPLVMLLFAWALVFTRSLLDNKNHKSAIAAGCALGLICWLRPEGPLYAIAAALASFCAPMALSPASRAAWSARGRHRTAPFSISTRRRGRPPATAPPRPFAECRPPRRNSPPKARPGVW
jgi:hypothetical protein